MAFTCRSLLSFISSIWIVMAIVSTSGESVQAESEMACSQQDVSGSVGRCSRLLTKATRAENDAEICRLQRRFIRCMERLEARCDISKRFEEMMVTPIRQAMNRLCNPANELDFGELFNKNF